MPRCLQSILVLLLYCITPRTTAFGHSTLSSHSQGLDAPDQARSVSLDPRRLQALDSDLCARSWLGYQCTQLVCGRIRIHWSLGGDPPSGEGCSYLQNTAQAASPDPSAKLLHIVLQTDLTEYVALSWPREHGQMAPADAVVGLRNGQSGSYSVVPYSVLGYRASEIVQDGAVTLTNTRVDANRTALTVCFTRNISQVGHAAGIRISAQQALSMNFVASASRFGLQHSLSKDYKCSVAMAFDRPAGGPDDGGWRPSNVSGSTGHEGHVVMERLLYMRIHGALQFTGWIVLVPAGMLAARHRWVFVPAGIVGLWFQVHRAVQLVAVALVIAGFVLPWTSFDSNDEQELMGTDHDERMDSDLLLKCHATLAIALVAALGLHIAVAALRPKPDTARRWVWNLVHWWSGRGLALLAGVNVALGIALWRRVSGGSGVEWIVPLVLFAGAWLGLAAWLERRAPEGLGREGNHMAIVQDGILMPGYVASSSQMGSPLSSPSGSVTLSRLPGTLSADGLMYNKL